LTNVAQLAEDNDCAFISYAGLILNTPHIDYFVTDDLVKVGQQQGQYIVDTLGLSDGAEGPFNIELVAGDPNDANARYFFNGAMSILQPYLDKGQLIVQSGQVTFDACSTMTWDSLQAQQRLDNILSSFYTNKKVDAVLCNNDSVALGVISALKSVGYGNDKDMPITTGQDANLANVKAIIAGEQSMTVYKNLDICAQRCAEVVDAIINGKEVVPDDTETYNNGAIVVPTILCPTTVLDASNYQKIVIDSGYYTAEELGVN
jgi:putative multiple sugar transport system substrate-binding protein